MKTHDESDWANAVPGAARAVAVYLLTAAVIGLAYFGISRLGSTIESAGSGVRVILPQAGFAVAALALFGLRYWPAIAVGSVATVYLAGWPRSSFEVVALSNTAAALAAAAGLRRGTQFMQSFGRVSDVYRFLFFAFLLGPGVSAVCTILGLKLAMVRMSEDVLTGIMTRWVGVAVSNLVVAPALLTWARVPGTRWPGRRFLELGFLLLLGAPLLYSVFLGPLAGRDLNYPLNFLPFPFVIWAALRFGARGASTLAFFVAALAVAGIARGQGPFSIIAGASQGVFVLQLYLIALCLSGLFLAAAVAERRSAEEALEAGRAQMQALSAELLTSREAERARIAREIHDDLGQQVTALKVGLQGLTMKLEKAGAETALPDRTRYLAEMSDSVLRTVRRMATELHPPVLSHSTLAEALEWLAGQVESATGMPVEFVADEEARRASPPSHAATAYFRVMQESLSNIVRHAGATRAEVRLTVEDGALCLEVEDDGRGITMPDAAMPGKPSTLGLIGMRERAALIGGRLSVAALPPPATGTRVTLTVPLDALGLTQRAPAP